jgi:hypothetical protein
MTVTQIVNNNIVASNQSAAAAFVASYPNNSAVAVGTIGAYGVYSGSDIAGSPVQNDAPYAWGGELMTALARGDTFRGGRIANIPSWVPSTAWQYVDIPGTRFDDYAKVDGTGILPAAYVPNNANTGGITLVANYSSMYAFGGACYSPKNHEMWIFGGGHDATTANCVLKWRLGQNSPDIVAITQPTTLVIQNAQFGTAGYASNAYWSDGQPHVAHMYRNLQYLDTIDELIGVSLTYGSGSTLQGDAISWPDIPGLPRGSTTWRSAGYWPNISDESGYGAPADMLCFPAFDQSAVYWSHASGPLRKLDATTKTITAYGTGLDYTFKALGAARHDQTVALVVGGNYTTADWNARMVDLTTGVAIAQTVVGMAWDTNSDWRDLIWCDSLGCWIAWLASVPNNTLAYSHIVKLTITGTNQLTATEVTTTGTGHTTSGGSGGRGLYWDSQYSCLILAGWGSANLKALKVS